MAHIDQEASIGFVVGENDDAIMLAQSIGVDDEFVGDLIQILKPCIITIEPVFIELGNN
jgi:hypothetical protein